MKNETIWIIVLAVLLLLIFNGFGLIFGVIKDILLIVVLILLVIFIAKQIKKKR